MTIGTSVAFRAWKTGSISTRLECTEAVYIILSTKLRGFRRSKNKLLAKKYPWYVQVNDEREVQLIRTAIKEAFGLKDLNYDESQ